MKKNFEDHYQTERYYDAVIKVALAIVLIVTPVISYIAIDTIWGMETPFGFILALVAIGALTLFFMNLTFKKINAYGNKVIDSIQEQRYTGIRQYQNARKAEKNSTLEKEHIKVVNSIKAGEPKNVTGVPDEDLIASENKYYSRLHDDQEATLRRNPSLTTYIASF